MAKVDMPHLMHFMGFAPPPPHFGAVWAAKAARKRGPGQILLKYFRFVIEIASKLKIEIVKVWDQKIYLPQVARTPLAVSRPCDRAEKA